MKSLADRVQELQRGFGQLSLSENWRARGEYPDRVVPSPPEAQGQQGQAGQKRERGGTETVAGMLGPLGAPGSRGVPGIRGVGGSAHLGRPVGRNKVNGQCRFNFPHAINLEVLVVELQPLMKNNTVAALVVQAVPLSFGKPFPSTIFGLSFAFKGDGAAVEDLDARACILGGNITVVVQWPRGRCIMDG